MLRLVPEIFGKNGLRSASDYSSEIYVFLTFQEAINFQFYNKNDLVYIEETDKLYLVDENNILHSILDFSDKTFIIEGNSEYVLFPILSSNVITNVVVTVLEAYNREVYFELGITNYPGLFWTSNYDPIGLQDINRSYNIIINRKNLENDFLRLKVYNYQYGKMMITINKSKIIN